MQTLHRNITQLSIIPGKRHPNLDLVRWELYCLWNFLQNCCRVSQKRICILMKKHVFMVMS